MTSIERGRGAIPSPIDVRNYVATRTAAASSIAFPEEFELVMPPVKDQGVVGSCVAHAIALIIEFHSRLQGDYDGAMSTGYIYGNRSNNFTLTGRHPSVALHDVMKYGTVPLEMFPENVEVPYAIDLFKKRMVALFPDAYPFRITRYYEVDSDTTIKTLLMQRQPVLLATYWNLRLDENNVLRVDDMIPMSSHAVVIYGWNKDGWLIQNSWGEEWGNKGCAVLAWDVPKHEVYAIEDTYSENAHRQEQEYYRNRVAELENELYRRLDEIEAHHNTIEQLRADNEKQEDEIDYLKSLIAKIKAQSDEMTLECKARSAELEALKKAWENEQNATIEELEHLTLEIARKATELKKLESEQANYRSVINQLEEELKTYSDYTEKLETLRNENNELWDEYDEKNTEYETLMAEKIALETELIEIKKPFSSGIGQVIAKIINFILNWLARREQE